MSAQTGSDGTAPGLARRGPARRQAARASAVSGVFLFWMQFAAASLLRVGISVTKSQRPGLLPALQPKPRPGSGFGLRARPALVTHFRRQPGFPTPTGAMRSGAWRCRKTRLKDPCRAVRCAGRTASSCTGEGQLHHGSVSGAPYSPKWVPGGNG